MPGSSRFLADLNLAAHDLYLTVAAPVVALGILWWLVSRTDRAVQYMFPDLEWERSLGWLNIRAERRAQRAMRWVGYGIMVLLFDSLCGIVWAAKDFPRVADWTDPEVLAQLFLRVPALGLCLFIWVLYFGCGLLPRLRAERENAAFRKFRAEQKALDEEREEQQPQPAAPRYHSPLPKPRVNASSPAEADRREWRRFPPGS